MRTVYRQLFLVALVLSTCAMRTSSAHAQERADAQERLIGGLIGAPSGEARVLALQAADGPRREGRIAIARVPGEEETEVRVTFERAGGRSLQP